MPIPGTRKDLVDQIEIAFQKLDAELRDVVRKSRTRTYNSIVASLRKQPAPTFVELRNG